MQEHDPLTFKDVAISLWGLLVTILSGTAARMNMRLSKLEESMPAKASSSDVDGKLRAASDNVTQRFRDEKDDHERESQRLERIFTEHRQETRDQFNSVTSRLDTIIERMMK